MYAAEFIDRWQRKAEECNDSFDRFFAAWIAIVIAARAYLNEEDFSQPDTDRKAILNYFDANSDIVASVLDGLPEEVSWLAHRKGTGSGAPLLDVHPLSPDYLREKFDVLVSVWSGHAERKPRWIANATAEMINHVRNNMFHGLKDPDDAADEALLHRINPILLGVLRRIARR